MTTRLSMSNLAGTPRTLVAVGTASDASMLPTTRAAGPRSGTISLLGAVGGGGVEATGAEGTGAGAACGVERATSAAGAGGSTWCPLAAAWSS